ncbi:GNAT family N-acetyltransferase [Peptostreptococcus faecalis]|uniref:GNAT family N-acetyltransferase n=1 Tax=Peptostreptococcus faecalis TaxID=2045015 RepID=UPI000C7C6784|nr:GNAT family N-acetyltransferase [Peptostreptococcus faecalis]
MLNQKAFKPSDTEYLVDLWERSVRKTHLFLSERDILSIKNDIPNHLNNLDVIIWETLDGTIVGFSGIYKTHLEALFIDPVHFRKGYGKYIIRTLINEFGIKTVDVNKDNKGAFEFYKSLGFMVESESAIDNEGRNFPLLHLILE